MRLWFTILYLLNYSPPLTLGKSKLVALAGILQNESRGHFGNSVINVINFVGSVYLWDTIIISFERKIFLTA